MTKLKREIVLAIACTVIIGIISGLTVILVRNNNYSKTHDNTSSGTIIGPDKTNTEPGIVADNKNISTFKSFSELIAALKAKGYFSQNTNGTARQYAENGMAVAEDKSVAPGSTSKADSSSGAASETNTQVSGVDEGDVVKTDGNYIYALANNVIRIIDPKNPVEMRLLSSITLDFNNSSAVEMYVNKDKLIVIGYYYEQSAKSNSSTREYYIPDNSGVSVKVYSITDVKNPVLFREFKVQGNLSSSRLIEDRLYLITSKGVYYYGDEKNITPQNILPQYSDSVSTAGKFVTIGETGVNYCNESSLDSFLNIASFNIHDTKEAAIETLLGRSGTVYMTKETLYVAYGVYEPVTTLPSGSSPKIANDMIMIDRMGYSNSVILKFSVNGLTVKYTASAKVPGSLLNQFALDEYNGFLRVATTSYSENTTQNNLYIYDKDLKETGKITGLAKGERIYSVRYSGDTGYIVTYRQTDPLFVIDLSNNSAPKVLGELKIPGFSNYMHVVGENLVLGIGRDTNETEVSIQDEKSNPAPDMSVSSGNSAAGSTGSTAPSASTRTVVTTGGIKISLFDVSDKANPKELDTVVIGDHTAYCEAQYNHKALIFDSKEKKLYLPFSFVSSDLKTSKIYTGAVISVSGKELKEEHYFQTESNTIKNQYEYYDYNARRFSYIGNNLFQIASDSITSYNKTTYEKLGKLVY